MSSETAVNDGDAVDRRTLRDMLLAPTPAELAQIGQLLNSALRPTETVLSIGHQLSERSLSALLEADDGTRIPFGDEHKALTAEDKRALLATLSSAAKEIACTATLLYDAAEPDKKERNDARIGDEASENEDAVALRWTPRGLVVLIRRSTVATEDLIELRIACVGNVDSGKSSTLGVLTKGRLDNGRGSARVALFRHKHEIESGRTSSVGLELLGYGSDGKVVAPDAHATHSALASKDPNSQQASSARRQTLAWEQICSASTKVISFIDLAGHERYLRTTLHGLTGQSPDVVQLIVGANAGLIGMSKEHLSVALALAVPVIVVVTKVDMTPPQVLQQTLKQLCKILRSPGCRKTPVFVKDSGMAAELAGGFAKERACPIFLVSNVTGLGLDPLRMFLNCLPAVVDGKYSADAPFEFSISDVFSVPFVGTVVSGLLQAGRCKVGDTVLLGPDSVGQWATTTIKSIHRKRVPVESAEAGQSVSFSLKRVRRTAVRKGMVLLAKTDTTPPVTRRFEAQILVLHHASTLQVRYQAMVHLGAVRQTVRLCEIAEHKVLRTGDRARVQFEFISLPEHIRVGDRLLFREGKTKGLGVVTKLLPNAT